ncbi:hypothetical protein IFR05_016015 [Cadophora sp. M221]|nr:hypothetical protein IFR05_016015 [Cadophora sp. M221]
MIHPRAAEQSNKPERSNANILVDIYNALQRLETSMDDQHVRIRTIEGSIRSYGGLPSHGQFSSIATSMIEEKDLPDLPRSAHTPSFSHVGCTSSDYEASVLNLFKRRFEFIDDSCSDFEHKDESEDLKENRSSGAIRQSQSPVGSRGTHLLLASQDENGKRVAVIDNSDTYSQSVYSSKPLSRLDLDIPPVPLVPEEFEQSSGRYSLYDTPPRPVDIPAVRKSVSIRAHISAFSRSVSSLRYRKSSSGIRSKAAASVTSAESSSAPSQERAEIFFHTYANLKSSVQSSISFRSKERVARREETRRLEDLSPVSRSGVSLRSVLCEKVGLEGKGTLVMINSLLGRLRESGVKFYCAKRSIVTGNGFA